MGQHAGGHVPVPRGPLTDLVLVEAEQVLALAVVLLDLPTHSGDRDQLGDRGGIRGVGEEELDLAGVGHRAADQQGVAVSLGGRLIFDGDRDRGRFAEPFTVDSSKIAAKLGVTATPLDQAIIDTLDAYRHGASPGI